MSAVEPSQAFHRLRPFRLRFGEGGGVTGAVVLGLRSAAYQSQIFRGAIQSISEGQMTAARSLGMTRWQAIKSIILPQAMRSMLRSAPLPSLPALMNTA